MGNYLASREYLELESEKGICSIDKYIFSENINLESELSSNLKVTESKTNENKKMKYFAKGGMIRLAKSMEHKKNNSLNENYQIKLNKIKNIIDDKNRIIINDPPFTNFKNIMCGTLYIDEIKDNIINFAKEFEKAYSIDVNSNQIYIHNYSNIFENSLDIQGDIYRVQLNRKEQNILYKDTNSIYLYYYKSKIKSLIRPYRTQTSIGVRNICNINSHFMPFLLTPLLSKCNILGLYTQYISSGAYICKLFDYENQCTEEERGFGRCNSYFYIGSRYSNIFPFNQLFPTECTP
jgi:hypothetical protein